MAKTKTTAAEQAAVFVSNEPDVPDVPVIVMKKGCKTLLLVNPKKKQVKRYTKRNWEQVIQNEAIKDAVHEFLNEMP